MAQARIQEYQELARDAEGNLVQAGHEPAVTSQSFSYTTATNSSAFSGTTRFIRFIADADAHLDFSESAATVSSMLVKANTPEYFGVRPGDVVSVYDGVS